MDRQNGVISPQNDNELFVSAEQVVTRMLELNESILHDPDFNESAIRALGEPPECPASDEKHLYCLMLFPAMTDAGAIFGRFWNVFQSVHRDSHKWAELHEDSALFRLKSSAKNRPEGPSWAVVELGRETQGKCVYDADRLITMSGAVPIGPELPLIGAVHPAWAEAMDGQRFPYLYAGDMEVILHKVCFHSFVPQLSHKYCCAKDFVLDVESSDSCCSYFGTGSVRYQKRPG